jgi:hypothetical protein
LCRVRKDVFKTRSSQHNKPTHPNNEVPPQDAQLQGVVSMASTQQTQTRSASTRYTTSRGDLMIKTRSNEKASTGKRCATSK